MAFIRYAFDQYLNMYVQKSRTAMCLGLILYLYLRTYFVYSSSEDSDEAARMRRLVLVFAARMYDKYSFGI